MKEQHSLKMLTSYHRCLRANRRHLWFFGSTEGYEGDTSDDEWDDHVKWYYGAQAALRSVRDPPGQLDLGMDVQRMLMESLDMADRIHREAIAAREIGNGDTNNIQAPEEGLPDGGVHVENPPESFVPDVTPIPCNDGGTPVHAGTMKDEDEPVIAEVKPMEVEDNPVGPGDIPGSEGGGVCRLCVR
ncbi:hypothetical protein KC19_VG340100 [Ceratodon purpureus]|uniref:Uncharacterized protein n=1 Tax=Ceratodon purpureus TaxID=3225 RepID=A0A8T0HWD0_CERPU|nr:hypothetical protein KC19_VG340100 [Ceratodon purpureus]